MATPAVLPLRRQRGISLIEALVAFLVLSLGILTVARVQTHLRLGSDVARQRSEAVRLAQEDLETLRSFSVVAVSPGARSYAEIASAVATIDTETGYLSNTRYQLTRDVEPSVATDAKQASVSVHWADRHGDDQRIVLSSIIAGHDPVYSAALGIAPTGKPVKGAFGRSSWIPLATKDLGNGRSAFKPLSSGSIAFVFDNLSGLVTQLCSGIDPALATRNLTSSVLTSCDAHVGYLLSGTVRFSQGGPPNAAHAVDVPLGLAVALTLSDGTYPLLPSCANEALKTVAYVSAGIEHVESVPIDATPATLGLATWAETGDRYVAYHCVVYPLASGLWSGRANLAPVGWTIGTSASDRRVCRFSADADGSGGIDTNVEHPASYASVSGSLANQNFLVISGPQACPPGAPVHVEGAPEDVYVNLATVQHQP